MTLVTTTLMIRLRIYMTKDLIKDAYYSNPLFRKCLQFEYYKKLLKFTSRPAGRTKDQRNSQTSQNLLSKSFLGLYQDIEYLCFMVYSVKMTFNLGRFPIY